MIRVGIVDDHPVVSDGLAAMLGREPGIEVVWTAGSLEDARKALSDAVNVDVVLLDVRLPDGSGLDLLPGDGGPGPAFLVLSSFDRPQYAAAAFKRGAAGFMLKVAPTTEIVSGVRLAARGGLTFEARHLASAVTRPDLTQRQIEVLRLVATGHSNDEISVRLRISRKTVEAHLTAMYRLVEPRTRTELALWAERQGWLDV